MIYTNTTTYRMQGSMGAGAPTRVGRSLPNGVAAKIARAIMIMVGVGMIFTAGLTIGFVSGDHTPPSQIQTVVNNAQDETGHVCVAEWGTNGLWDVTCPGVPGHKIVAGR